MITNSILFLFSMCFGVSCLRKSSTQFFGLLPTRRSLIPASIGFCVMLRGVCLLGRISTLEFLSLCAVGLLFSCSGYSLFVRDEQNSRLPPRKVGGFVAKTYGLLLLWVLVFYFVMPLVFISMEGLGCPEGVIFGSYLLVVILGFVLLRRYWRLLLFGGLIGGVALFSWISFLMDTQGRYTEAASSISSLRIKIKFYQMERNDLPGAGASGEMQFLGQSSPWQRDLDIDDGEYGWDYFHDTDYSYYRESISSNAYIYCVVATSGDKASRPPPRGTGYAFLEIQLPSKKTYVMVFERFVPKKSLLDWVMSKESDTHLRARPFNTIDFDDDARANCIPIPTWSVITDALTTAEGELDVPLLEQKFGFSVR